MAVAARAARRDERSADIEATLSFSEPVAEKAFAYAVEPPPGAPRTNVQPREVVVPIEDVRPLADRLSLDVQGVAIVRRPTAVRDFWDKAQTLALGHPEAAQLVKDVTGASRVVVFDHTLRRREAGVSDRTPGQPRQPAGRVHVDQTVWSGPQRVRDIMGEEAEALLMRRAAIINVWRPIAYPAVDWPLAFADARSVEAKDLVPSDLIFEHRRGETYNVTHNPAQRWLYVPDLQPDEAILLKCWDSDTSVAQFAPHTGFDNPNTPPGAPPRQSIEFRTIAFFD
jgi:hypothetical protein